MMTKICFLGAGHIGGLTSSVIALKCPHVEVTVCDVVAETISKWNSDKLPFYEPGLYDIVKACRGRNLFFTNDYATAIEKADVIFITANVPTKTSGIGKGKAVDLQHVENAARMIAWYSKSNKVVVEKSTVPVRAAESIMHMLNANKSANVTFQVLSNPAFLAQGCAIEDLLRPQRILIGSEDSSDGTDAFNKLCSIYEHWVPKEKIISSNTWSSELSALATNAMLAQRISSINSLSAVCESVGADVSDVSHAIGCDSRIGSRYLHSSIGFGGSRFQRDILNLIYICEYLNLPEVATYWQHVIDMNEYQKTRFSSNIVDVLHNTVKGKRIALLGFSIKKNTVDTQQSPAIHIAKTLLDEGATLHIYDPKVEESQIFEDLGHSPVCEIPECLPKFLKIYADAYSALNGTHAIVLCTAWDEFMSLDYKQIYSKMMKPAYIFDGCKSLDHPNLMKIGFHVHTIGKKIWVTVP
ncbi:hypothetical protein RI129_008498 [Pyrocoelia pectoralis]|uniref:UDP-glucose 6-dehydrogenase n=1 Tax=Pyrocoelia pectoralis TaxID=417401 RepID=A0AAN7VC40_9COLE